MDQLPLMTFLRSLDSCSGDMWSRMVAPVPPSRAFTKSFILRSCSMSFPSSRHSCSKAACSFSAWALSAAISLSAESRLSYARLDTSMMRAISFFFSASSFSSLR